jgi:uncharacterized membrane protein YkvA (DUF1232 family)
MERAQRMSEEDLKTLLAQERLAQQKLTSLTRKLPAMARQVKLGFAMLRDYARGDYRKIPWWSIASLGAALGYFIMPTDMIPDFIPFIGYLDDAAVLAAVMNAIREDMKRYCEARGVTLED